MLHLGFQFTVALCMSASSGKPEPQLRIPLEPYRFEVTSPHRHMREMPHPDREKAFIVTSAASIRKKIRLHRQALEPHYQHQSAISACKLLNRLTCFRNARNIALYLSANGELDPLPVLRKATDMGKTCFLPVLHPMQQRLWFTPWQTGAPLDANRFGIPEPKLADRDLTRSWALDLVLTPLVAFDSHGTRLGMGGGYYDRSFAYLELRRHFRKPLLIGYGYEFQRLRKLKRNHWDVPIHVAVTDQHVYEFSL